MSRNFLMYVPAQISSRKECVVYFYAMDPQTQLLKRVRYRCNRIKNKRDQLHYARKLCAEINQKLYSGWNPFVSHEKGKTYITLREASQVFLREKNRELRKDSMRSYHSFIKFLHQWLGKVDNNLVCINFTKQHAYALLDFAFEGKKKLSNTSWNNYLRFFRSFFAWLLLREYCTVNYFEKIPSKRKEEKKRDIISPEDRTKIQDFLIRENPEFWAVCAICFACFIRPKEILELKAENIDIDKRIITVPASVAKNHKTRNVVIPSMVVTALENIKYRETPKDWYLFSEKYKPGRKLMNTRDIGRTWQHLRASLNLPNTISFYSLKDTGISTMLDAGVSAKVVQQHADHSSIAMTEKYNHQNFELYKNTITNFTAFTD